ncbi:MAG: DNA translocase FtsK [Planctomycetota bacterium]|jgi:S-DNA-T family DNA segregation ATPase FtsK/SpoIIIE
MKAWIARLRDSRRFGELAGLLLVVFGLASFLALVSYHKPDTSFFHHQTEARPTANWIGVVGANLAEVLLQLFGVAAFLMPFVFGVLGWVQLRPRDRRPTWGKVAGYATLLLALVALLDLLYGPIRYGGESFAHAGGYFGGKLAGGLRALLATTGAVLFTSTVIVGVLIVTTRVSLVRTLELTGEWLPRAGTAVYELWTRWVGGRRPAVRRASPAVPGRSAPAPSEPRPSAEAPRPTIALRDTTALPVAPAAAAKPEPAAKPAPAAAPKQPPLPMERGERTYTLPQIELLAEPQTQERESEQELLERAKQIEAKFNEFAIEGSVVAIHPGPVVTTFEFRPEAGVKYSKITGMTDDLSLALKAESVRIDRLAGRSTVGIEVPNRRQETIYPRELIGSERFRESRSKLTLALGKDIHGEVYCAELDRMPHLLIAGTTGAGKSVGLNGMITSMLYKATPDDLRFIMIDTKMIELGVYAGIPHLLVPVVTEPKLASTALQWAVREMELRYRKLASLGVRNIAQFNAVLEEEPDQTFDDPKTGEPVQLEPLPYIVIVIDEMADLMMVCSADVEESVMRLAQMARAVGIHLILATQRPSVDVITGTIKANFPSRIAFRVSQRVDSRTIIDQQGAEHLLGRGDMLLLPTGSPRVIRMHSGYITEPEINRITSFLKRMAEPQYDAEVLRDAEEPRVAGNGGERDEMFVDAVRTVLNEGKCSITLIQRRLQLGYARAARIVDMMEQEGVVSAGEGSKPREVLVGPEIIETLEARR